MISFVREAVNKAQRFIPTWILNDNEDNEENDGPTKFQRNFDTNSVENAIQRNKEENPAWKMWKLDQYRSSASRAQRILLKFLYPLTRR